MAFEHRPSEELCGVLAGQGLTYVPHDQGVEGAVREETLDHWHVGSARCNPQSSVGAQAMVNLLCWACLICENKGLPQAGTMKNTRPGEIDA